jgi:hypothetical protein
MGAMARPKKPKRQRRRTPALDAVIFMLTVLGSMAAAVGLYIVVFVLFGPSDVPPFPKPIPRMGRFGTYRPPDPLPNLEELRRERELERRRLLNP